MPDGNALLLLLISQSTKLNLFHRDQDQERKWNGLRSNQKVTVLQYDQSSYEKIKEGDVSSLEITLPTPDKDLKLTLEKNNFLAEGFFVSTDKEKSVVYNPGMHYKGKIVGEANSLVAISFYDNEVMAVINESNGTQYTVGSSSAFRRGSFVAYNATKADAPSIDCKSESLPGYKNASTMIKMPTALESRAAGGCVNIYFELGQSVFANKNSSVTEATNYLTGIFNVVSTLYNNDGVTAKISQILVWTTPEPYAATADNALTTFGQAKQLNFNGQLAQLIRLKTGGSMSGIAWVDVLCHGYGASQASGPFSYAEILPIYNSLPTFSWTAEVITHELGHNLGSPHTQSCSWPGGPIDNCVAQEGSCPPGPTPTNGGTIMSYCHLTSIGINFNNGFGPQPKALILNRIASASCVVACSTGGTTCNTPTGLSTSGITTSGATLSWAAVSGASSYAINYKTTASNTWLPLSAATTSTSIALNGLAAGTSYDWQVRTNCGSGTSSAYVQLQFNTTSVVTPTCVTFPPTGLSTTNIAATTATISWNASTAAVNYNLYIKTTAALGWTLLLANTTSLSANITNLSPSTSYQWQVQGNCVQGSSAFSVTSFTTTAVAANCTSFPPTGLSTTSISTSGAVLNWSAVATASSYAVQYKLQSSTSWITLTANTTSTTATLSTLTPSTAYNWQVRSNCSAGSSVFVGISFSTSALTCDAPSTLSTSNIANTSAIVSWSAANNAFNYTLDMKAATATQWTNVTITSSLSASISGLIAGTAYQWRVSTNCSSGSSAYAQSQFTTTGTVVVPCNAPASLTSSNITTSGATISWAAVSGALNYSIEYKLTSSGTWILAQTAWSSTIYSFTGLSANTIYDWHVRTNCSSGSSAYTAAQFTTTAVVNNTCPGSLDLGENGTTASALPVPFNTNTLGRVSPSGDVDYYSFVVSVGGSLTVTLTTLPADYDLRVYNAAGSSMGLSQNGGTTSETLNLNLSAGTYYVRVYGWGGSNSATSCYTLKVQTNTATIEYNAGTHFNAGVLSTTVFPNPANATLNYRIQGLSGPALLTITDLQGRQIMESYTKETNSQLNISSLSAGFYFLRVQDENKNSNVIKFLKTL